MLSEPYQVIYLTGPPATGKTTLVEMLEAKLQPLLSFTYSKVLAQHVSDRDAQVTSQDLLREKSAQIIRPEDIEAVDQRLLKFVRENRSQSHIIIDSHAVTKENFGYRVTPFSLSLVLELRPTRIFMLYAKASVIQDRIAEVPAGRPRVTTFEADFHAHLQATVALTYGINLGIPVYFLDSSSTPQELSDLLIGKL